VKRRSNLKGNFTAEAVPKPPIPLVGHGFSRAKILAINRFANLKVNPMECKTIPSRVCPTQKIKTFDPVSAECAEKAKSLFL